METGIYQILIAALSILLSIVGFAVGIAVKFIIKMAADITEMKINQAVFINQHEAVETRLTLLEKQLS